VFVPGLIQPRLTLVEIAKKVQKAVHDLAATVQRPQDPAYYDGVIGDIYLTDRALESLGQDDLNAVLDVRSKPDGSNAAGCWGRFVRSEIPPFPVVSRRRGRQRNHFGVSDLQRASYRLWLQF